MRTPTEATTMAGMRIAVTGATGRLGPHAVELLERAGHAVVAISRSTGVDVISGDGLDEAFAGADVVVDAATTDAPDQETATEFFTTSAANVQAAAQRAGVRRIVVVSIIATDRFTGGYNAAKAAHERALLTGPVPVRILRAAQFHELVEPMVTWGTQDGVAHVREMRVQLVAARAVAEALVDAVVEDAPDLMEVAGPRPESLVEAARRYVAARELGLQVEAFTDPSDPDDGLYTDGTLLPGSGAKLGGPTFEEWLRAA
jgi:uncharacterized protein YbjT (DUF2867 family)